jgi:Rrf2 family protein
MLSKRTKYALSALVALAREEKPVPLMTGTLALRAHVPKKFLEQILLELKGMGIVNSRKGKKGGYYLTRPAKDIHIGSVIRVFEGPLALLPCASRTAYERCEDCPDETACGLRLIMMEAREATARVLDKATIQDAVDRGARNIVDTLCYDI